MLWIKKNVVPMVGIGTMIVLLVNQWQTFAQSVEVASATDQRLRVHELDNRRHVDFDRDQERWADLLRRLDRIERKIDR